ncbi:pyruvate dehydrogenase (acetyl-transferring), homodimeric type [Pseudomaricurvus alkylphenolicus]|uniref:pyruvate dehydrogenase (acetyl-transferring), homodimeric type n=1 Tax=Pseudomaricurvus alkylphenolicus TaxID=1306991 RepID=UPI0014231396|nr:pyruvate dehydrogenase (acetyl-transferring), homodimeric type [Pseudomaricurvus alkylphenolicus]NIB42491.1 pyruvate dehydrogenase (acetyl-transferring), homodimeric type [Pseudomaricurvus alkylphenolicus]
MSNVAETVTDQAEEIAETREWLDSLAYVLRHQGGERAKGLLRSLQDYLLSRDVAIDDATLNTPYINTIDVVSEPRYPGDLALEKRIENIIRWNAMAMVLQAQDRGTGVGGHIATYASAATLLEVGFHHVFRSPDENYGGDTVLPQPHAAPGVYARAFLEGRLTEQQLRNFRRELGDGGGLCSYPHPRSMPEFWQVPNASMGLSTPTAIYQARFAKYLESRGLKPANGGKVWCFIGDGESDEPEVLGSINIAAREKLDNLVMVVNCNLQRLDGPVRGNGKIIQELERSFRGAGWNVIKVIWGSGWDALLARDENGVLRQRMDQCLDGDYQMYSVLSGGQQREHWVEGNPQLERLMQSLTDEELKQIRRGGHDPKKIFAAFEKARSSDGKPTVILAKTVKGEGMGASAQGRNTAHQKKNLSAQERVELAREYGIPLSEEAAKKACFYRPGEDSEEVRYLQARRQALGGYLPRRDVHCQTLPEPSAELIGEFAAGTGERAVSTTAVLVRLLARLCKDRELGRYIVPIVPDEARTFGMDSLFKAAGIYSPAGQQYRPVDADSLLPYREAVDGQILQEGICETGAMASFLAAGTAYAVHGVPTIPFYVFYSMFGFQRVGDMIWAGGDMMSRGFLVGGTAGRTTLNGEGLQHQDGHSHMIASTVPNLISYDPAFGYEVAVIVQDGIRRMYQQQENIFYYLTVYNENYPMPALPDREDVEQGILKGGYCYRRSDKQRGEWVQLLASGSIMQQALVAADLLEAQGYRVNVWSITSFVELERDALACERFNRLNPLQTPRQSHLQTLFANESGVYIAASDYMKALANGIARWVPGPYDVLGTDGYGLSEAREPLRDFFEISANHIAYAAVVALYRQGGVDAEQVRQQAQLLGIDPGKLDPLER